MNYLELLKHSYEVEKNHPGCPPESPLEYLGDSIFNFTTYDGEMSALFARKAVEVVDAITTGTTFDYIKDAENYRWLANNCDGDAQDDFIQMIARNVLSRAEFDAAIRAARAKKEQP